MNDIVKFLKLTYRENESSLAKKKRLKADRDRKRLTREVELHEHNEMECNQSSLDSDSELPSQGALDKAWNEAANNDHNDSESLSGEILNTYPK